MFHTKWFVSVFELTPQLKIEKLQFGFRSGIRQSITFKSKSANRMHQIMVLLAVIFLKTTPTIFSKLDERIAGSQWYFWEKYG